MSSDTTRRNQQAAPAAEERQRTSGERAGRFVGGTARLARAASFQRACGSSSAASRGGQNAAHLLSYRPVQKHMKPRSRIRARRRWFRRVMDEDLRALGLWECKPARLRAETNPRITALVEALATQTMPTETRFQHGSCFGSKTP